MGMLVYHEGISKKNDTKSVGSGIPKIGYDKDELYSMKPKILTK